MSKDDKIFDPNDHFVGIAVRIVQVARSLPKTKVVNQISGQLIRRHSANCKQIKGITRLKRIGLFAFRRPCPVKLGRLFNRGHRKAKNSLTSAFFAPLR